MISSWEIEATLGCAKVAFSPRVRMLTLSSFNTFWLGAVLSGSLVLMGSPCCADIPAEVAIVLLKTVGAAAVMEDIVAVLLLSCCCDVAAVFGAVASFTLVAVLLCCCGTGDESSFLVLCSHSSC